MNYLDVVLGMVAGLALFLYGVTRLSLSLNKIAGDKVKSILERFTSNIFFALLSGIVVTIILDSSSVTIIMVIALVNSGLVTFPRAIGVIMGANIGTTFSSQIIAFQIEQYAAILLFIGFVIYFLSKKRKTLKYSGLVIFGFGLIYFGLALIGDAAEPLKENNIFIEWIASLENPWKGVLIGAGLTAIIQSSSATMGIVITMAGEKIISLAAGVAVMLGSEIGTCADTLIASVGRSKEAVRAGIFHLLFNVITVGLGVMLYEQIALFATVLSPQQNVARQIANAHLIFNVGGVFLFAWFTPQIASLLQKLIPEAGRAKQTRYTST